MKSRREIFIEMMDERARQDEQWGGPNHDDRRSDWDWNSFRRKFEDRIVHGRGRTTRQLHDSPPTPEVIRAEKRGDLLKIAALAVAQIESLDRLGCSTEAS